MRDQKGNDANEVGGSVGMEQQKHNEGGWVERNITLRHGPPYSTGGFPKGGGGCYRQQGQRTREQHKRKKAGWFEAGVQSSFQTGFVSSCSEACAAGVAGVEGELRKRSREQHRQRATATQEGRMGCKQAARPTMEDWRAVGGDAGDERGNRARSNGSIRGERSLDHGKP